jgi:gamma-glutamylcyclotransferase (GGCT)/AIG2-like uncharacterized protein YtfP
MVIVWQYGSNMDEERLNGPRRLNGMAKFVGLAIKKGYRLAFTHTSTKGIAVCDIVKSAPANHVIGCLYEIPSSELPKLDKIEGVNSGAYRRISNFSVERIGKTGVEKGEKIQVMTYAVVTKEKNLKTDSSYANHILKGAKEHGMCIDYLNELKKIILQNNPAIEKKLLSVSDGRQCNARFENP